MDRQSFSEIQFINHASLLISNHEVGLLSDPWFQGDAFHKGWNLLHELEDAEIKRILDKTSHIWISHEHPDHFSISFFMKFSDILHKNDIQILYQKTLDKRVENFLRGKKFNIRILETNEWIEIGNNFKILNFKDGFYDSGLAMQVSGKRFLNLNDCNIRSKSRCSEILRLVGECDVLISQFSYAAWKGGRDNIGWRKRAAKEKLETLAIQSRYFRPKVLIPFASFVYFSNKENFYLNDSVNTPNSVIDYFSDSNEVGIKIMKPFQKLQKFVLEKHSNKDALEFWKASYLSIHNKEKNTFESRDLKSINSSFQDYKNRIFENNSRLLIRLLQLFSPISVFKTINIYLHDINETVMVNLFQGDIITTDKEPEISMTSESLDFIFKNTFGFDTLTVNGCFEELKKGSFSKMTRALAIENLNNIGIRVNFLIFLRIDIITLFLRSLLIVSKKINT
tara:strand:- start:297 stop:1652 length:1356 start_codon:yes stop_codon:yes gene_type:complete